MSLTSLIIKTLFIFGDRKRDQNLSEPENLEKIENLTYGDNRKWQTFDLYRPKESLETLPLIINIHGGAWVYGDKDIYAPYCKSLATAGFVVMNASYRLAPKFHFPSQVEDVAAMVAWALEHAQDYQFDKENIFLIGDSAGAHLASIYLTILLNQNYRALFPTVNAIENFLPRALVLNCGIYDMKAELTKKGSFLPKLLKDLIGRKVVEEDLVQLSPITAVTNAFPPTFLMTSNQDFLKHQTYLMQNKLYEKGIQYQMIEYGDDQTPQGHVFHLDLRNSTGEVCRQAEIDFLRANLAHQSVK